MITFTGQFVIYISIIYLRQKSQQTHFMLFLRMIFYGSDPCSEVTVGVSKQISNTSQLFPFSNVLFSEN